MVLDADELKLVTGKGGVSARLWLLVAWIPDDSKASSLLSSAPTWTGIP